MSLHFITWLHRFLFRVKTSPAHPELQRKLGYRFKNREILERALTHRSYLNVPPNGDLWANERLEFLGDSILGMVTSWFLFENFPDKNEGDLTKLKSTLVSEANLSQIARSLALGKYLRMSEEEEKAGGRERSSIVSDAYEAVIGAVFLDGGLAPAEKMIRQQILEKCLEIVSDRTFHNFKGELLEYMQALGMGLPKYEVTQEHGPDHQKRFTIQVSTKGKKMGEGVGKNKKEAEQKAAKMALENIEKFLRETQSAVNSDQ